MEKQFAGGDQDGRLQQPHEHAPQEFAGEELGERRRGIEDAGQHPPLAVLHHRDAAVDQDHHHHELHQDAGNDMVETRRDLGDGAFGQARSTRTRSR